MKNKNPNESIFRRKGFYVALYGCLGVVMVSAAAVAVQNLSLMHEPVMPPSAYQEADLGQLAPVGRPGEGIEEAIRRQQETAPGQNQPTNPQTAPNQPRQPGAVNEPQAPQSPRPNAPQPNAPQQEGATATPNNRPQESPQPQPERPTSESETHVAPVFNPFTEGTRMIWPVMGEVVMNFSTATAIYDPTLDQFRTNDVLCISADLGTQVVAATEGVVLSVERSREHGNKVVIDNGNGWTTTYSQLQDGVLVREGDVVRTGQVIGGVASPSIYSVLLGTHVGFRVTRDDVPVDPLTLFE